MNKDIDMNIDLCGIKMKNPIMTASGTFGSGMEYSDYIDLSRLGAVVTKGVAIMPWEGNPTPRIAEVYGGMLNAIGLQNAGLDTFLKRDIPFLQKFDTKIIVNVCGHTESEYLSVVERLSDEDIDMMEINISCPNVKEGGISFGTDPRCAYDITNKIKKISKKPISMKLSPNVTSIAEMAKAVEAGGADCISLINSITGMKIDIDKRTFAVANRTGGMSGPAIHPIAVRMVYEASHAVSIPIIGMGGIYNTESAIEMLLAGADAIAIGMANFINPQVTLDIIDGIYDYMVKYQIKSIKDIKMME